MTSNEAAKERKEIRDWLVWQFVVDKFHILCSANCVIQGDVVSKFLNWENSAIPLLIATQKNNKGSKKIDWHLLSSLAMANKEELLFSAWSTILKNLRSFAVFGDASKCRKIYSLIWGSEYDIDRMLDEKLPAAYTEADVTPNKSGSKNQNERNEKCNWNKCLAVKRH